MRISNPVWVRHVNFCSGKFQRHASPTVNPDFASKEPVRSSRLYKLHATLQGSRFEIRVPSQTKGCVPSIECGCDVNNSGRVLPSIQGYVPSSIQSRVFRAAPSKRIRVASSNWFRVASLNNLGPRLLTIQDRISQQVRVTSLNKSELRFSYN